MRSAVLMAAWLCVAPTLVVGQGSDAARPLSAGYRIRGVVVDAAGGAPLRGTRVIARQVVSGAGNSGNAADTPAPRTSVTDDSGMFSFLGLAPGKYALSAVRRGYPPQLLNQHENLSTAVVVGPDLESDNIVFRLEPECSISGRVLDENNDPVRHARVTLLRRLQQGGREVVRAGRQAQSDDDGSYHFAHLPPGTFLVAVVAQPWYAQHPEAQAPASNPPEAADPLDVAYPLTFYPSATDADGAGAIVLQPGDRARADVALSPVPSLHIRITTGYDGTDPRTAPRLALVRSWPDGVATIFQNVYRGPGVIELYGIAPGQYEMSLQSPDGKQSASRRLDLSDDASVDMKDGSGGASLSGMVRWQGSVSGPRPPVIQVRNIASGRIYSAPSTEAGEFSFPAVLPAGTYDVFASSGPGVVIRSLFAAGAQLMGRSLQIAGPNPIQLTVTMAAGAGRIDGVALRNGKPLAGAMIVLVPQDPQHNQPLFRRDQSDSDGSFTLLAVVPGDYTAVAIENGWDLDWSNPAVLGRYLPAGQALRVEPRGRHNIKVAVQ